MEKHLGFHSNRIYLFTLYPKIVPYVCTSLSAPLEVAEYSQGQGFSDGHTGSLIRQPWGSSTSSLHPRPQPERLGSQPGTDIPLLMLITSGTRHAGLLRQTRVFVGLAARPRGTVRVTPPLPPYSSQLHKPMPTFPGKPVKSLY